MSPVDVCTHDVPFQGQRVRALPAGPPGPSDPSGQATGHRIVAVGQWSDDHEEHFLTLLDLQVTSSQGQYVSSSLDTLLSWKHIGAVTDIKVSDLNPQGEVLLAVASSKGSVCLARLLVPRLPGTSPADIQILDLPCDDAQCLVPWAQLHKGPVMSVDVQRETKLLLSCGQDGALWVLDPSSAPASEPFKPAASKGYTSFAHARWADSQQIVSVTSAGQLELWDTRQGPKPSVRAPPSWGVAGPSSRDPQLPAVSQAQARWLDVHPSRPNLCALGGSGGLVALWDLRMHAAPLAATVGASEVWEVQFDTFEPATQRSHAVPPVLFATSDGVLGQLGGAQGHGHSHANGSVASGLEVLPPVLQLQGASLNSFDLAGGELVAVTDSQQVVYAKRSGSI